MFKKIVLLFSIVINSIALTIVPAAFANGEPDPMMQEAVEAQISEFLQSGEMRHLPLTTENLNDQGKVGDYIVLPSGDYLIISFDLGEFTEQPGMVELTYTPSDILTLEAIISGTNDLMDIGNGPFAASIINRSVDTQLFCSFTGLSNLGFVAAGKGLVMVNGVPLELSVEFTVIPANIAAPLLQGYFIAVPSEDCKWTNPAARAGCLPTNCSTSIGIGWFSTTVTGVCKAGTLIWPLNDVKRCDCAI